MPVESVDAFRFIALTGGALRWCTSGDSLINPLVAHFLVRTLGVVDCAVTDWLVLFQLVTDPPTEDRLLRNHHDDISTSPTSDTTAPHVTILRSCSDQKEVSEARDPLREDREGRLLQTG